MDNNLLWNTIGNDEMNDNVRRYWLQVEAKVIYSLEAGDLQQETQCKIHGSASKGTLT